MPRRLKANAVVVGFASGVLVTVLAVMAAFASAGAGHGHYVVARVLFPASMLLTLLSGGMIGEFSIILGLLQFPLYGTVLGRSIKRKKYFAAAVLTLAHVIAASVCFAGALPNFS